jgi:LYR motif-containing protein 4
MQDYNVRFYAFRRTRQGFAENRELSGSAAQQAYAAGQEQLAVLKRQALLSQIYPSTLSVMENENIAVGSIDTRQR